MLPQQTALVGREREQQRLNELLTDTSLGRGRLVLLSGEAGIGKTTLVRDLARVARERRALVLSGACYDLTTTPPYGPWSESIRGYRPSGAQPLPPVWFGNPEELSKIGSQPALFDETRSFFASVASHQPVVVVLEDLHWSDPSSVDALRFLARTLTGAPVLLVATYRDDEGPAARIIVDALPSLVRESGAERIELRRWNEPATRRTIADHYALIPDDEGRLMRYVHQLAEGNPFHTIELLRSLEGDGTLMPGDSGWRVGELSGPQVPPLVRQVVERRLARLPGSTRELLEVASVIGYGVTFDLWSKVSRAEDKELLAAVEEALEAHLIDELVDRSGFQFRHALVRETLYAGMVGLRLRAWHVKIAETLIEEPATHPDLVAHHFQQAGDDRALEWTVRAAERAQGAFAWNSAAERFDAAQRLLDGVADQSSERGWLVLRLGLLLRMSDQKESLKRLEQARELGQLSGDRALKAYAHFYIGLVRHYLDFDGLLEMEAGIEAIDALDESELAPLHDRIAAASQDYLPGIFGLGDQRGTYVAVLTQVGRLEEAIEIGEAFIERVFAKTADELQATITCRDAFHGLGASYAMVGRTREARNAFENAYRGYRGIGNQWVLRLAFQHELDLLVLPFFTDQIRRRDDLEAIVLDAWQQAIQVVEDADNVVIEAGYGLGFVDGRWKEARRAAVICSAPYWEAVSRYLALRSAVEFDLHQGEFEQFWEGVYSMLPEGSRSEPDRAFLPTALRLQQLAAELCIYQGDLDRARAWLEFNDEWVAWSGSLLWRPEGHVSWSRYFIARDEIDQARKCAERARAIASDPRQPLALIAARRALGAIETLAGNFTDAEQHLLSALRLAEICRAPYEIALTRLAQAELVWTTRDLPRARDLLTLARKTFDELGAVLPIRRVDQLAASLARAAGERPAGLSPREVEVLSLVAEGLSNREIADRLFLSTRTVERHLTNIYGKVGADNRVEAAAFARAHGLSRPDS